MVAYRTYPHVDMAETGARCAWLLARMLDGNLSRLHKAARRVPFPDPADRAVHRALEPARAIYAALAAMESAKMPTLSFTPGFPAADFPECGPVVFAYGGDKQAADAAADALAALVARHEGDFDAEVHEPRDAVRIALRAADARVASRHRRHGRTTLARGRRFRHHRHAACAARRARRPPPRGAALGLMVDPAAAAAAHAAGPAGARSRSRSAAARASRVTHRSGRAFRIEALADGHVDRTGPFYRGARMELALGMPAAGGRAHRRDEPQTQLADQALLRFVGIEPTETAIVVVKSSVHFRADFAPIAEQILVAAAPGPMIADPEPIRVDATAARHRLRPHGPVF